MKEDPTLGHNRKIVEENYSPSPEQQERLEVLLEIVVALEKAGIRYSIMSGYGLDGLYGSLTRDHKDIDMLVMNEDFKKAHTVIEALGFNKTGENLGAEVYLHPRAATVLELVNPALFSEYSERDEVLFFPLNNNASLKNVSFRAATIEGQERISKIQLDRIGWDDDSAREVKTQLIEKIKRRMDNF